MDFAHLHTHSMYSTLDGFGDVEEYAKKASKLKYKYLALTDHGNIDGLIKFQKACIKNNIVPISGCELYIVPKLEKTRRRGHILVLVKNNTGFRNLCKMLTFANKKGFYHKPRVTYDCLLNNMKGLVVTTACLQSFVNLDSGKEFLKSIHKKIGEDLYFEVMPHKIIQQRKFNSEIIKLANKYKSKTILTNDCHYVNLKDSKAQEILLAIQRKQTWNSENRWKFPISTLNLKSRKRMFEIAESEGLDKSYLDNTIEVAEKCEKFILKKRKVQLPKLNSSINESKQVFKICSKNFKKYFPGKGSLKNNLEYYERYLYESNIIEKKDFMKYFLIVYDFISWCKINNITIGPGRGSVGCSLIAFLLEITIIDPIKWQLPFERFYAEDRTDYPDIDIDVEHSKINLVIEYLEIKYGKDNIAAISTFNRLKSRAAVKDVARVFEVNERETNNFTQTIDQDIDDGLEQALMMPKGIRFQKKYPSIIKYSKKLVGQIRARSKHAAGIVVSKTNIGNSGRGNLVYQKDSSMINWEKNDSEFMGLMKFDILALKTLSILGRTIDLIYKNHKKKIKLELIPLNNKKVLKEINAGFVTGLFQLTGYATKSLVSQMNLDRFDDIVATIALARPGPLESGMASQYVERKAGKKWEPKHKIYEEITKKTYGLLVYQEQVMRVIKDVAGLPYTTADKIRKVIGKKRDPIEFKKYEKQFIDGCKKTKIFSKQEAKEFWNGLQNWARYGFNLAHSIEYAIVGYQCAWLKYYYPTEFICASLTYAPKDKKSELVEEAYRLGLELVLPMVNNRNTDSTDWIASNGKLYVPFTEVENIGTIKAIEAKNPITIASLFEDNTSHHDPALAKILYKINAYRTEEKTEITREMKNLFGFRITNNPLKQYPNLYKLFDNNLKLKDLDLALEGNYKLLTKLSKDKELVKKFKFPNENKFRKNLSKCERCLLIKECISPVSFTTGTFNIMITAEAPGFNEDKKGIPLCGKSGSKVWKTFDKRKYRREQFHVTNINKCYPKFSNNPDKEQIDCCSYWIDKELKTVKPVVILAFGGNALYYFTHKKSGITHVSGKTEWNEEYSCWICWCIHPSATFRSKENQLHYKNGLNNFFKTLKAINFNKMI